MSDSSGNKDKVMKGTRGRGKAEGSQRKTGACSAATFSTFRFWPVTVPDASQDRQNKP
jgi:hypothetical protein